MIQEMSGTARKLVTGKRPDWLSFNGGVARRSLGRPQIPELSEYLNKYFKQSRRRKSMNQYIVRKTEVYQRAKQALARSCPISSATPAMTIAGRDLHGGQACGVGHGRILLQAKMTRAVEARATQTRENHGQILGLMKSTGRPDDEDESDEFQDAADGWEAYRHHTSTQPDRWSGYEDEDWTHETPELLPEFLQGWYLLMDANLTSAERNLVQTAVQGNFGADCPGAPHTMARGGLERP